MGKVGRTKRRTGKNGRRTPESTHINIARNHGPIAATPSCPCLLTCPFTTNQPPRMSMHPAFPPLSLFFTAEWNGAGAFNALANLHGIKYKFHFSLTTCSLQLSSSDSEIVPPPSGCGFDAGPLSLRPWVWFRAAIFL